MQPNEHCPFCGKTGIRTVNDAGKGVIECRPCGYSLPPEIWNRRASPWISVGDLATQAVRLMNEACASPQRDPTICANLIASVFKTPHPGEHNDDFTCPTPEPARARPYDRVENSETGKITYSRTEPASGEWRVARVFGEDGLQREVTQLANRILEDHDRASGLHLQNKLLKEKLVDADSCIDRLRADKQKLEAEVATLTTLLENVQKASLRSQQPDERSAE